MTSQQQAINLLLNWLHVNGLQFRNTQYIHAEDNATHDYAHAVFEQDFTCEGEVKVAIMEVLANDINASLFKCLTKAYWEYTKPQTEIHNIAMQYLYAVNGKDKEFAAEVANNPGCYVSLKQYNYVDYLINCTNGFMHIVSVFTSKESNLTYTQLKEFYYAARQEIELLKHFNDTKHHVSIWVKQTEKDYLRQ